MEGFWPLVSDYDRIASMIPIQKQEPKRTLIIIKPWVRD